MKIQTYNDDNSLLNCFAYLSRYMNLCTMMKDSDAHQNGEFSGSSTSSTSHCEKDTLLKLREKVNLN